MEVINKFGFICISVLSSRGAGGRDPPPEIDFAPSGNAFRPSGRKNLDKILICMFNLGSLLDVIRYTMQRGNCRNGVLDEVAISTVLREVIKGLDYFHSNGHIHRYRIDQIFVFFSI